MPALSKRTKQARNLIIKPSYSLEEGVKLLKQTLQRPNEVVIYCEQQ